MTDTDFTDNSAETTIAGPGAGQFTLEHIYLKDCSFESPLSPAAFTEQFSPELNVNIQTQINGLVSRPEAREVVLSVTVDARVDGEQSLFVCEAHLGALVAMGDAPEEVQQRLLGARVPEMLFPYVRETVSNLVVRGGFMPMMLQPIDFDAIYEQQATQQNRPLDG
jgi:preprotein translocase subunit SecB